MYYRLGPYILLYNLQYVIVYVLFYAGSMVTVNACHPGVARTDIHRYMPIRSSTVSIIRQILTDDDMLHVYKYLKRVET